MNEAIEPRQKISPFGILEFFINIFKEITDVLEYEKLGVGKETLATTGAHCAEWRNVHAECG